MLQSTDSADLGDDEDLRLDGDAGDIDMPSMVSATMLRQMRCWHNSVLYMYAMQLLTILAAQGKHFAVVQYQIFSWHACSNSYWCLHTPREACCASIGNIHHVSAGVTKQTVPL